MRFWGHENVTYFLGRIKFLMQMYRVNFGGIFQENHSALIVWVGKIKRAAWLLEPFKKGWEKNIRKNPMGIPRIVETSPSWRSPTTTFDFGVTYSTSPKKRSLRHQRIFFRLFFLMEMKISGWKYSRHGFLDFFVGSMCGMGPTVSSHVFLVFCITP